MRTFDRFEKNQARSLANLAIKKGILARQPCEVCGNLIVDAHHDDYAKPLDVRWLCRWHHAALHKERNRTALRKHADRVSSEDRQRIRKKKGLPFLMMWR